MNKYLKPRTNPIFHFNPYGKLREEIVAIVWLRKVYEW